MQDLWQLIKKYEFVSFDVFDTLIKRNVNKPSDVFELVNIAYIQQYGYEGIVNNFKEQRIFAERKVRSISDQEITLANIYGVLAQDIGLEIAERYKKLEIEVELDICTANQDVLNVFKKCVEFPKKVLIITDMYLPIEIIEQILEKNGFKGYKTLYLSSQSGKSKD